MVKRTFQVFINPMHGIQLTAHTLEIVQNVLVFKRDGEVCGQFTQYMGWVEIGEEKRDPASVTTLSLVPKETPAPEVPA